MNITDIKVRKLFPEGELKAILSITFDSQLVLHDVKLIKNGEKIIIAMPNRRTPSGFIDIVHPVNAEFRAVIDGAVKKAYEEALEAQNTELRNA